MVKRNWVSAVGGLAMAIAACSSPEEMSGAVGGIAAAKAAQGGQANAPRAFAMDDTERDGDGEDAAERGFIYNWPAEVSAIPDLAQLLAAERDDRLAEQKAEWEDQRLGCPPEAMACKRNQLEVNWQVVADTPRFLSLSSSVYAYGGGAHGNFWRTSLVWDRTAGAALEPAALFTSIEALGEAIRAPVCRMLDRERAKRRGQPVPEGSDEWPDNCPPMDDTVVFLGSAKGARFDRIGIYYAPYVAGPYAEGEFEFTLAVSPAILAAVKPEYRDAFAPGK